MTNQPLGSSESFGRPPTAAAGTRKCVTCSNHALWLVPEVSYCGRHLPDSYREVAIDRRLQWADRAGSLWQRIVNGETQTGDGDERDADLIRQHARLSREIAISSALEQLAHNAEQLALLAGAAPSDRRGEFEALADQAARNLVEVTVLLSSLGRLAIIADMSPYGHAIRAQASQEDHQ